MLANIWITLLLTLSPQAAQGVLPGNLIPAPQTKLEAFAARTGALLGIERYSLMRINGEKGCSMRLQVVIMYEIGRESQRVEGLAVDVADPTRKDTANAYIDLDELYVLSRGINSMLDMNQKGTAFTNPSSKELSFSSAGGLKFSMVQRDSERELVVTHIATGNACTINRDSTIVELKNAIDKVLQDLH